MPNKLLSIIVPAYNMEAYLAKGLQSLVIDKANLLQKLDVIIINDGSSDRTSEIAHRFESKFPGIFRVIDKSNGHYGSCINTALPIASGIFIKVMDADDSFDTIIFAKFLSYLDEMEQMNPNLIDVVFSDYVRVNRNNDVIAEFVMDLPKEVTFTLGQIPRCSIETLWMTSVTYRTNLFKQIEYHQMEGVPFTDQQWVFYPMSVVRSARYFPLKVYKYYVGREGQSIDETYYAKNFHVIRKLTEKMIEDYPVLAKCSKGSNSVFLEQRLYARIKLVYQYHLFSKKAAFNGTEEELIEFDRKLKAVLPKLYEQLASERYVRRLPLSPISAWRKKVSGNPIPYMFLTGVLVPITVVRYKFLKLFSRGENTHG